MCVHPLLPDPHYLQHQHKINAIPHVEWTTIQILMVQLHNLSNTTLTYP